MNGKAVLVFAAVAVLAAGCGGASPQDAGPSEDIQVHGDWTIDVYNEDGTLDRRVEFSNGLMPAGEQFLLRAAGGIATPSGEWEINIKDQSAPTLCAGNFGCTFDADAVSIVDGSPDVLRLSGSTVIETDGNIESVETYTGSCIATTAPADCSPSLSTVFTYRDLAQPEPVVAGQIVQVQVDISFTTG